MQFEHEVDTAGREFDFDDLLRRVTHGEMIGEISHPTRRPDESQEAFSQRVLTTRLDRACCAERNARRVLRIEMRSALCEKTTSLSEAR